EGMGQERGRPARFPAAIGAARSGRDARAPCGHRGRRLYTTRNRNAPRLLRTHGPSAMRLELTPAVARALQAAQLQARRGGAVAAQPAPLPAGRREGEGGGAAVLRAPAGLDLAAARQALAGTGPDVPPHPTETPLPLSPASQVVLDRARDLAADLSPDRTVPSEAVLLALLREDKPSRRTLEGHGLAFARLEADLLPAP